MRARHPSARWADPSQLHLTLRFLGPTPPTIVPVMSAALSGVTAGQSPFDVGLGRVGSFGPREASTLWLGLEPASDRAVTVLARAVADALRPLTTDDPAEASFRPHLTLCRHAPRAVEGDLERALASGPPVRWRADRLQLVRSVLSSDGARHSTLVELPFDGA